ncbi:hypothetical protein BC833DRAFT_607969 [Globomyces pollinis-pini]|nr:hypothetical protein BC833DRAFT_607969 [Globomyces pollinis-pini]
MVNLLQLSGAMFFNGVCFTQSTLSLIQYGVSFNVLQDKARQMFLNLLCFISVFFMVVYYFTNQSGEYPTANDICLLAFNICIQYGLVILMHNSIVKLTNGVSKSKRLMEFLNKYVIVLYLLPLLPLSLVVMAIQDSQSSKMLARKSIYNTKYYKPISIALVISVNVISSIADYILMSKVLALKARVESGSGAGVPKPRKSSSKSMSLNATYNIIAFLVVLDIVGKILVILDYPAFDSTVTLTCLAFRSAANLKFGTTLRNIYRPDSSDEDYSTNRTRQNSLEASQHNRSHRSVTPRPVVKRDSIEMVRTHSQNSKYATKSVNLFATEYTQPTPVHLNQQTFPNSGYNTNQQGMPNQMANQNSRMVSNQVVYPSGHHRSAPTFPTKSA